MADIGMQTKIRKYTKRFRKWKEKSPVKLKAYVII